MASLQSLDVFASFKHTSLPQGFVVAIGSWPKDTTNVSTNRIYMHVIPILRILIYSSIEF